VIRLFSPRDVRAEVSKSGESYMARGWVTGTMHLPCNRCLKDYDSPFKSDFEAHYLNRQDAGSPATGKSWEETETVLYDGDSIDLADEVRQAIELSIPTRALCREDCRGLCPSCGADLNQESCRCPDPPRDNRWAALKDFKPRSKP
jgi:uncharacterized protein